MDGSWENAFCLKGGDGRRLLEGLRGMAWSQYVCLFELKLEKERSDHVLCVGDLLQHCL